MRLAKLFSMATRNYLNDQHARFSAVFSRLEPALWFGFGCLVMFVVAQGLVDLEWIDHSHAAMTRHWSLIGLVVCSFVSYLAVICTCVCFDLAIDRMVVVIRPFFLRVAVVRAALRFVSVSLKVFPPPPRTRLAF